MINKSFYITFNYILLFTILLLSTSSEDNTNMKIIVLPFKTIKPLNSDLSESFNITTSLVSNQIYTDINMTTQTLTSIFNSQEYAFTMTSENCPDFANYYIGKSKSFMNISGYLASERMLLYRDYELKTIRYGYFSKMKLKEYNNKKQCAIFGLKMKPKIYDYESDLNFIITFKSNDNVNSTQWTLKYTKEDEGFLIIGESPIIYDPMFKNKKYIEYRTYAAQDSEGVYFGIEFDDIYLNNKSLNIKNVHFCHDLGVILVNRRIYEEIQEIGFKKYIDKENNKGICKTEWVFGKYGYIQCDSNRFTQDDINSFPTIYFKKIDMGYIFELNSQDLFSKNIDGKIYFLILFDLQNSDIKIGKPFHKKYPFTVDNEKNTISLFLLDNESENSDKKDRIDIIYIVVLVVVIFILISIASFFAYQLYLKKGKTKKRANELDEDYEYLSKDNDKNEKNDNINSENNNVGNLGI